MTYSSLLQMNVSKNRQILPYFWNNGMCNLLLGDNTVDTLRVYGFNRLSGVCPSVLPGNIEESNSGHIYLLMLHSTSAESL